MNPYGCSLIYGHSQGPTGLRGIVELAYALSDAGGSTASDQTFDKLLMPGTTKFSNGRLVDLASAKG